MFSFLNQPYPFNQDFKQALKVYVYIGIFIGLFLIIFQPFGNAGWHTEYKTLKLMGYGFVSFLMPTLLFTSMRIIKFPQKEENWTTGKEAIWLVTLLFMIAWGNIFYSNLLGISNISFSSFLVSLLIVLAIGIFPIMASIALKYSRYKKLNESEANKIGSAIMEYKHHQVTDQINTEEKDIMLTAENNKDSLTLAEKDILYLESTDNYTYISYLDNGQLKKELLRGSLTRFQLQIQHPSIVRCHRSYVVNLTNVLEITGNAQGYKLTIAHTDKLIPVARNYGKDILSRLEK